MKKHHSSPQIVGELRCQLLVAEAYQGIKDMCTNRAECL